jgi:hypothetical protein
VLIAVNRQAAITRAFLIGAACNLGANLLAIPAATLLLGRPEWALYAAAAITILSELVLYLVFRPLLTGEGLAPGVAGLSWRPLLAALAMGAVMLALRWPLGAPIGTAAAVIVAPPTYALALWLIGGVGAEERALAMRILGRGTG